MLKEIWNNRMHILNGLFNRLFSTKEKRLMARARRIICDPCEFNSRNTDERPYGALPYEHCTKCGCMLDLKTFSTDAKCPIGKW
jgi:hypothetical protein